MGRIVQFGLAVSLTLVSFAGAALAQSRNALVIGNSAYVSAPKLKTPATDAAIVAETLRAAGYDVTELHDVNQATIGQSLRDFLDKVAGSGPDGAAIVYYSGHGAQSDGANYLIPVDAVINSDADVANEAFRLNDLLDELAKIPLAARIVVLDASRDHKFGAGGDKPVAKGLAMGESIPGMLLAFAAAPGALADDGDGDYSLYTGALVTQMRQPGLDIEQIFRAVRLEVNKATNGSQTPWMVSDLAAEVRLFETTAATPAPQATPSGARIPPKEERNVTKEMLRGLSPDEAYAVTVEEDTLETYQWFIELYPKHAFAPQVWDTIETRREAVLWQRTLAQNTTRAYWNYLKRYPKGAHVTEAQDQLAELSAATAPPPAGSPRRRRIMSWCRRRCRPIITTKPSASMKCIRKATTRSLRCSACWRRCSCRRRRRATTSTATAISSPIAFRRCAAIRCGYSRLATGREPAPSPEPIARAIASRLASCAPIIAPPPACASIALRISPRPRQGQQTRSPALPSVRPGRRRRVGPSRDGQQLEYRRRDVRRPERRQRRQRRA
ncbi:MAG: caspase family protein [Pseudolabrys sp.]|nr:caspase family protein [Pseudolabrys sp.]